MASSNKDHSRNIKRYKVIFSVTFIVFIAVNFPVFDWFLHSEKMWYGVYELDYESSYMYALYDKLGILDDTVGYLHSMEFGSKWMHLCYHLYNFGLCIEHHPSFAQGLVVIELMGYIAYKDIKLKTAKDMRRTIAFYIPPLASMIIIFLYGAIIYAPRYNETIYDIVSCI